MPSTTPASDPASPAERPFNLLARTVIIAGGRSLGSLAQIVGMVVIVRLISEETWESVALLLSIYFPAITFGGLNVELGYIFFHGHVDRDRHRSLVWHTVGIQAVLGLLTAVVIAGIGLALDGSRWGITEACYWLAPSAWAVIATRTATQILLAAERPGLSSLVDSATGIAQLLAMAVPLVVGGTPLHAAQGLCVYSLLRLVMFGVIVLRYVPRGELRYDGQLIVDQIRYSLPLGLSMGASVINRNVDKWFVAAFTVSGLGSYALAAQELPMIAVIPYAMAAALATRMVQAFKLDRRDLALAYWHAAICRVALVVVPAAVAVIWMAPELFPLVFTETYSDGVLVFQIYSLILLMRVVEYGMVLRAAGDTKSLWWTTAILLGANVVLNLPMTMLWGTTGAATASVLAALISWVYVLGRIAIAFGVPIAKVWPFRFYGTVLAVAIAVAAAGSLATAWIADPGVRLAAKFGFFAAAYLIIALRPWVARQMPAVPHDDPQFELAS